MSAHPLFPIESELEEPAEVNSIYVARISPTGQRISCPRPFSPTELQSESDIFALFGGGTYVLTARGKGNAQISGNRQITLDGAPRPLVPPDMATQAPPVAPPIAAGGGGLDSGAILLAVMQSQQENQRLMATMMQESSKQMIAMMTAMMGTSRSDSQALVQSMAAIQQASTAQQGELYKALLSAKHSEGGSNTDLLKLGLELGQKLKGGDEDEGINLGQVLESLPALAAMMAPRPPPAPSIPPPAPIDTVGASMPPGGAL